MSKLVNIINSIKVIAERICFVLLVIGLILITFDLPFGTQLLGISCLTLAVLYLFNFIIWPVLEIDTKLSGFLNMMVIALPKAMWLGVSIISISIVSHLLNVNPDKVKILLWCGISVEVFSYLILLIYLIQGQLKLVLLKPILWRVVPIMIIAVTVTLILN